MAPEAEKVTKHKHEYRWLPILDAYEKLVALQFADEDNFANALEIVYGKEKGLPFDLVGFKTLIVPEEAIECFSELNFTSTEVLSAGDLPPEEIAALRRENM